MNASSQNEAQSERSVLSLEQYARVTAHLAHFEGHGSEPVLKQLGVATPLWAGAKEHWLGALQAEFDDDAAPLAVRFGAAFATAKDELERERPALDDVPVLLEPPKVGAEFESVDETTLGVAALAADALPFASSAGAKPPPPAAPEERSDDVGMTQLAVRALAPPPKALPFLAQDEIPALTLTQYASLHAELAHTPDQQAAILARYGVPNEDKHAKLEAAWSDRFASDPKEQSAFEELVAAYVGWLKH